MGMGFGTQYREHVEQYGFCPLEAMSEGYEGPPLHRRPALFTLLADAECEKCGELPGDCDHKVARFVR